MDRTKPLLAVIAVLAVVSAALVIGLNEQRFTIATSSGSPKVSPLLGDSMSGWGGALAQSEVTDNTLFVGGMAVASDDPDKVTIVFSVDTEDMSALESQQDNARISAAVRAALVARGIASGDIETVSYQLYQIRDWDSQNYRYIERGFRTSHSMQVELADINRAGEIIDAAVGAGANSVSSVAFGLSDARMEELRMQALEEAAGNARQKADSIARGLGVTISRVMSATEGYSYTPVYRSYEMSVDASGGAAPTEITPGDIQVTAQVNVVYEIA